MVFRSRAWCLAQPSRRNVRLDAPEAELTYARCDLPGPLGDDAIAGTIRRAFAGLARRVALASAFAVNPDLLVLDEPFVSLDAAMAQRLRSEWSWLVRETGYRHLLVTHDGEEAIAWPTAAGDAGRPARIVATVKIRAPALAPNRDRGDAATAGDRAAPRASQGTRRGRTVERIASD